MFALSPLNLVRILNWLIKDMSLITLIFLTLFSVSLWANEDACDKFLRENPEMHQIEEEKKLLSENQQKLAGYIEKDWTKHIWNYDKHFSNPSIYTFLKNDPKALTTLEALGFKFTPTNYKTPVEFPANPWVFLKKAQNYQSGHKKIIPAITIQHIYTKEFRFITKPSELPKESGWTAELTGFLDEKVYYKAIQNHILPMTVY